jgi:hypothetical protein
MSVIVTAPVSCFVIHYYSPTAVPAVCVSISGFAAFGRSRLMLDRFGVATRTGATSSRGSKQCTGIAIEK